MFGLGINKLGTPRGQALTEPETLLFANDEEGTFLDLTTTQVYADTAGTDPAEVSEGIALTLDKSQGGVARRNLLTYSEDFGNAAWVKTRATINSNVVVAPDGTLTADKLIEDVSTNSHFIQTPSPAPSASGVVALSCFAKADTRNIFLIVTQDVSGVFRNAFFDVSAGEVLSVASGLTASIEPFANGWFRCCVVQTQPSNGAIRIYPSLAKDGSAVYTGDGTSGLYIWGAQIEEGSTATEYQKITTGINGEWTPGTHSTQATSTARPIFGRVPVGGRRNLLERTEEFDDAYWAKERSSVTPNVAVGADGTTTADEITATETAATVTIFKAFTGIPASATVFYSAYFKASDTNFVFIQINGRIGGTLRASSVTLDLSTNTLGTVTALAGGGLVDASAVVEDAGGGLYRLTLGGGIGAGNTNVDAYFGPCSAQDSRAATIGDSIIAWGAQLELGSTATNYQRVVTQHDITEAGVPSVYKAFFDKSDDILPVTLPTITGGTVALVGLNGIWIEDDWDFTAGTLNIGPTTIAGLPAGIFEVVGDLCAVIINDRAWTAAERAGVIARGKARAGDVPVYSQVATFNWDSGTTDPAATYDKTLPVPVQQQIYDQIRGCTLNTDGTVNYYLKSTDWAFKADDTASNLTGADGNVMVEIPKFYYRTRFTGTQTTWEISPVPLTGFQVHPAFILDGVEVSKRYYGAYDACVYDDSASAYISGLNLDNNSSNIDTADDKLASVKGVYPMVGLTRNEFRLLAANIGTGWRQLDFYLWSAVGMLYAVEYQTFYNQDELGNGNTNNTYLTGSADQNDSPHTIAGYRDDVGNGSTTSANGQGTATNPGTVAMKYRGIENLFGNCWKWADAININVGTVGNVHLATDNNRANYADDTTTNYTLVTDSLTTGSSNIQAFLPLGPYFLASAVGGTSEQYVTDRHYGSASANRVARVGGSVSDGGNVGVFALLAGSFAGIRSRAIGARLAR